MSEIAGLNQLVQEFVSEAIEIIDDLSEKLVELEKNNTDENLLKDIFRSMHTIKGSSGFVGYNDIGKVAHKAEDILNKIRKKEAKATSEITDVLLASVDVLSAQISQIREGKSLSVPTGDIISKLQDIFDKISNKEIGILEEEESEDIDSEDVVEKDGQKSESDVLDDPNIFDGEMKEIVDDFIVETRELIDKIDNQFVQLEGRTDDLDLLNEIFRSIHTIKGTGSFLGFKQLTELTHIAEDLLNVLRKGDVKVTEKVMDILLEFVDAQKMLLTDISEKNVVKRDISNISLRLSEIRQGSSSSQSENDLDSLKEENAVSKETTMEEIREEVKKIEDNHNNLDKMADDSSNENIDDKKPELPPATPVKRKIYDQTIRVDVNRLEELLNLVGELVLGKNRLQKVTDDLLLNYEESELFDTLSQVNSYIGQISKSIQGSVMKTRMVAIGKVFNKFPRMVRDLSRQSGKDIELVLDGVETELDRTLVEEISDPLVHLIRNSADHGIESPAERKRIGKPKKGKIHLFAAQEGDNIVIGIEDDGKGLDMETIKKKAVTNGLVSESDLGRMTDKEIFNFIFAPGFSTAKQITNVSGRGVGMDVVKSNISKLNGHIDIESEAGKGTLISINLPLTLAIITGLLVNVKDDIFVIPISAVKEITTIEEGQLKTVNKMEVLNLRDQVIPLIRLTEIFNFSGENNSVTSKKEFVVIVASAEKRYGIVVDSVKEGQAEVVIKKLGAYMPHIKGIAGGTIMGDGRVRLIIDIQEIINMISNRSKVQ